MLKRLFWMMVVLMVMMAMGLPSPRLRWVKAAESAGLNKPVIDSKPVIEWGNTSYHDSLGVRNPYIYKEGGTFYLYYDCIEDMVNPSFEPNLGTNGWQGYKAKIESSGEKFKFGSRSLKVVTEAVVDAGAYTGAYFYPDSQWIDANMAIPSGMEAVPNSWYLASVYVWAENGVVFDILVKQYQDDPKFYVANWLTDSDVRGSVTGNGEWQRVWVKFKTKSETRAVTISMANKLGQVTTSYWDGAQLEKINPETVKPGEFPVGIDFNDNLEDTVGWRSCLAVSTDGRNFQKKGMVKVGGKRGEWEKVEKTGWVGTSNMSLNVFKHLDKYYSYTWEGGYDVNNSSYVLDKGESNRRIGGYGDRRAQLPTADTRSGLVVANSPLGPFVRVSQNGPVVTVDDGNGECRQDLRTNHSPWGCEYLNVIGVPQRASNGKWFLFLAGQTLRKKGVWEGTLGPDCCLEWGDGGACVKTNPNGGYHAITGGLAWSDGPLGPWKTWLGNPMFEPGELCSPEVGSLEGPYYYFDRTSGNHVIFVNAISGGGRAVEALWTKDIYQRWPITNRKTIVDWYQIPWNGGKKGAINLATVVEDDSGKQLLMYFGARDDREVPRNALEVGRASAIAYLFYNIGLATIDLPLLTSDMPPTPTPTVQAKAAGDFNGDGVVNMKDLVEWKKGYLAGTLTLKDLTEWKKEYM